MIKNLYCCFYTKTQYSLILNYRGVGEAGGEGGLTKLYKTHSGEPNYVDHKFFFSILLGATCSKTWGQTSIYYRGGWLAAWCMYYVPLRLHDIKKLQSLLNTP